MVCLFSSIWGAGGACHETQFGFLYNQTWQIRREKINWRFLDEILKVGKETGRALHFSSLPERHEIKWDFSCFFAVGRDVMKKNCIFIFHSHSISEYCGLELKFNLIRFIWQTDPIVSGFLSKEFDICFKFKLLNLLLGRDYILKPNSRGWYP